VLADIPGIIEGANEGVGLGLQFLRHIERTRLLLHVIDVSGMEGRNPVSDFEVINEELEKYSEKLPNRKQIIVANKIDAIEENQEFLKELEQLAKDKSLEIFKISAVTGEGVKELFIRVAEILKTLPKEKIIESEERVVYTLKEEVVDFDVFVEEGEFVVAGRAVEKIMGRINVEDNESMHYFHKMLKNLGVDKKLKKMGVKEGDTVKIVDYEFEWQD